MQNAIDLRVGPEDPGSAQDKLLPHDRDEKAQPPVENAQHRENRKIMEQARRDVESGLQDTERIGTPNDVPSSDSNAKRGG